jgi:hypothetical protein
MDLREGVYDPDEAGGLHEHCSDIAIGFGDVPNICCEVDKYIRVKKGEGKMRARFERSLEPPPCDDDDVMTIAAE